MVEWVVLVPIVRGMLAGALAAAAVDFQAFRSWRSFDEAKAYDWKLMGFRVAQGAVLGALAAIGIGAVT